MDADRPYYRRSHGSSRHKRPRSFGTHRSRNRYDRSDSSRYRSSSSSSNSFRSRSPFEDSSRKYGSPQPQHSLNKSKSQSDSNTKIYKTKVVSQQEQARLDLIRWNHSQQILQRQKEFRKASREKRKQLRKSLGAHSGWDKSDPIWNEISNHCHASALAYHSIVSSNNVSEKVLRERESSAIFKGISPSLPPLEELLGLQFDPSKETSPRLYIGNIHFEVTQKILRNAFSVFGPVFNLNMSLNPLTGIHKGFCFVEFFYPDAALFCLFLFNGHKLCGRSLTVGLPRSANLAPFPIYDNFPPISLPCVQVSSALLKLRNVLSPQAVKFLETAIQYSASHRDSLNETVSSSTMISESSSQNNNPSLSNAINPQNRSPGRRLEIRNVSSELTADSVKEVFSPFGEIVQCNYQSTKPDGSHNGVLLIEFAQKSSADSAKVAMDGFPMLDSKWTIFYAENQPSD